VGGSLFLPSANGEEDGKAIYFCIHYAKSAAIIETGKELTYNKT